jgi:hypothetical protein
MASKNDIQGMISKRNPLERSRVEPVDMYAPDDPKPAKKQDA